MNIPIPIRLAAWALLVVLTLPVSGLGQEESEQEKLLKRYAAGSLRLLQQAIKSEGFYNARAALNIWKSNAMDAGTFDEAQYNALKVQIYKKSIEENLKWFDIFLSQKNTVDAKICLQMWRSHSEEIGLFDEARYEELLKKLK